MIEYIYIAIGMISLITIFQIKNIFTCNRNSKMKIKLFPIIITLILGIISVNNQKTFKHAELGIELTENKASEMDKKSLYEHEISLDSLSKNDLGSISDNLNETIKVDGNNPMLLEDIRLNPEKYIGKELEIHGFVCKENYLNKNQFIIGRIIMTCCAADSKIIGIIGEYDKVNDLKENDNVKVIGLIGSSTIKDDNNVMHNIPVIKIKELHKES
jgi:uncharacterized repeat protein (TIGR03943 family)